MKKTLLATLTLTLAVLATAALALDLSGPLAARFADARRDPATHLLDRMETHLGLTAGQRATIDTLVRPFVEEVRANRGQALGDPVALLAKLESGAFAAADVRAVIDRRLAAEAAREERLAGILAKIYATLDDTQRRIVARLALERIERAGERLDMIEKLPSFPIAKFIGLPDAECARLRGIALPILRDVIAEAKKALGDPKPLAEKFMAGAFTAADFKALLSIRGTVGAACADRIAAGVASAWAGLPADLKATLIEKAKAALSAR